MDALRYSKKISLLAVAILFLFTFFTLILDAPRKTRNVLNYPEAFIMDPFLYAKKVIFLFVGRQAI
jgi:hypothetical protein